MRLHFFLRSVGSLFSRALLFVLLFSFVKGHLSAQTATSVNVSGTNYVRKISSNTYSIVDSNLTLSANGSISGFTVTITGSYTTGDSLSYTGILPSGVTAAPFNSKNRSLVFSGITSAFNWQALLRTVRIKTTSSNCSPGQRSVSFTVSNKFYNPMNGHFYEYYSNSGSWTGAESEAQSRSYFGRQGYLATLTSVAEQVYVGRLTSLNAWIACSDSYLKVNGALGYTAYTSQSSCDGDFYWVCGPERGTKISSKNAWVTGGVIPVPGVYNNWATGEPNDAPGFSSTSPGQENYGHILIGVKQWNDFPDTMASVAVFEYGGMPNDLLSSTSNFTREVQINASLSGIIIGGGKTVCPGSNSCTLTLTGSTGTVLRWQASNDDFVDNWVDIVNTSTTLVVSNISSNTYYRAVLSIGNGCSNLYTSSTLIAVDDPKPGTAVPVSNVLCSGAKAKLTLFGYSGVVQKWQMARNIGFTTGLVNIADTSANLSYTMSTTGTYYFRAVVQAYSCTGTVNSAATVITVNSGTNPVGGFVNHRQHCAGTAHSGTLSLSGHSGSVSMWQSSVDGGVSWKDIASVSTTYNYSAVNKTTWFRAVIVNGSCGKVYSAPGVVTVYGATITRWLGSTNNDWGTASNWCGGVADNGIDVIVDTGAVYDMSLDQARTVGNLDFNNSGVKLILNNNHLTASSFSGSDSLEYVRSNGTGKLFMNISNAKSVFFPLGTNSYTPLLITNNTGSPDVFSLRVFDEVYDSGYSGNVCKVDRVKKTWDISKQGPNGNTGIDLKFYWNSAEAVNILVPVLYHYESPNWVKQNGSSSFSGRTLTYIGYTGSFSPFAIGNLQVPLPLKWVYFDAERRGLSEALLRWQTASEENTSHFDVLRSRDAVNWEFVGSLESKHTSGLNEYQYTDVNVTGEMFYQVLANGSDGEKDSSEVVFLSSSLTNDVLVYPNPSKGELEIRTTHPVSYSLIDMNGKLIVKGNLTDYLQLSGLSSGLYLLNITQAGKTRLLKLIVY